MSSNSNSRTKIISDKIHALIWVASAISVANYTDLPHTLLTSPLIHRPIFNAAITIFIINCILMFYLVVYLPKFKNIKSSGAWDVYCPRVIPTMTFLGVVDCFLFVRCTWPVYGFLAPLILGIVSIGSLFTFHFIPSFWLWKTLCFEKQGFGIQTASVNFYLALLYLSLRS